MNSRSVGAADHSMIDIIIPVLNEEKILSAKKHYYQSLGAQFNLVFVDGGSADRTVEYAQKFGTVISCRPGRAYQKNAAAKVTDAPYLLFLHVDTFIKPFVIEAAIKALKQDVIAGCFSMKILDDQWIFRVYEATVNVRAHQQGVIDGDLGLFIRRSVFDELQGFDQLPIMDDIVFSKRLRQSYPITVLPHSIEVSARKWHETGFLKTFGLYTLAYLQLWTGIPFFKDKVKESHERQTSINHICT